MVHLRTILTLVLAFALVAYGAAAKSPAHAHSAGDVHAVHFIAIDDHAHDHDAGDVDADHDDKGAGDALGADHHKTGLHSHSAPQFSQADAPTLLIAVSRKSRVATADPQSLIPMRRDSPPFKPPRLFL